MLPEKKDTISQLREQILLMQGHVPQPANSGNSFGLGPIESAFPHGVFPLGALHEFTSGMPDQGAAAGGFIAGLLSGLMKTGGTCLWISRFRTIFPPALNAFGVPPDKIIFVELPRERDVLWAMEESLKCEGLSAVVCELSEVSFTESRRLQLAIEKSKVTGFIVLGEPKKLGATACAARWRISPLPSALEDGMPGVGLPRWRVELLKVRNGNPATFQIGWSAGKFIQLGAQNAGQAVLQSRESQRKAG